MHGSSILLLAVNLRMGDLQRPHRMQSGGGALLHSPDAPADVTGQEAVPDIGHLSQQLRIGFFPQQDKPTDWTHMLDMTLYCPLPAMDFTL